MSRKISGRRRSSVIGIKTSMQTAQVLRELANRIETVGLVSCKWSVNNELIRLPTLGTFIERRSGPKQEITILLEWADIKPANKKAGEVSEGI